MGLLARALTVPIPSRGFQSSGTAELMLKRAKKMKYNPARKKKLLGELINVCHIQQKHFLGLFWFWL